MLLEMNQLKPRQENLCFCLSCECFAAVSRELPVETVTVQTQLHQSINEEHYTYTNVPWRLYLRKEVCTEKTAL